MGIAGKGRALVSEINVTPLVDVMLVLLIIFMVAAPMMKTHVDIDLPKAEAPREGIDEEKLLISIDREARVFLGDQLIPPERLEEVISTNERIRREKEVYIQADAAVAYGKVIEVLGLLRKGGVERLGLVAEPMGGGSALVPKGASVSTP
ncbi:MAG: ExbD/TolR family protein [Deltaproteobacteria bacterium]|nr:ExbD/TolR family protein [Sandaracinaceae bacterium]MCX7808515.1 ExbD/TolR family protein [Deltaproteobacteria bacterium]